MPPKRTKSTLPRGLVMRAGGKMMYKLGLYVSGDVGQRFRTVCAAKGMDMSAVVEQLITAWLAKQK